MSSAPGYFLGTLRISFSHTMWPLVGIFLSSENATVQDLKPTVRLPILLDTLLIVHGQKTSPPFIAKLHYRTSSWKWVTEYFDRFCILFYFVLVTI